MLYAAIDIHKHAFQAAVLDPEGGKVVEARFSADRESLARWAEEWQGRVAVVAIEATTGWRWVVPASRPTKKQSIPTSSPGRSASTWRSGSGCQDASSTAGAIVR